MSFITLKANGNITNSTRFKEVRNENILRCLTERIHSLDDNFTLHSVYLMLKKYPILCNVLDTPDLYSPVQMSPVQHFMSFFKDYENEFIEPNFLKTAHIHQLIAFSKSDYEYKFGDIQNIHEINNVRPVKLDSAHKYHFENQYEMSLNNFEAPSVNNDFCRYGLSRKDIDAMSHHHPIKVEIGNILFFYSESVLNDQQPVRVSHIAESGNDAINITLIDFLETIINQSIMIQ